MRRQGSNYDFTTTGKLPSKNDLKRESVQPNNILHASRAPVRKPIHRRRMDSDEDD